MKVFRISGRDATHTTSIINGTWASMKVFRISGRDDHMRGVSSKVVLRLNESLPHKRKRHT